MPRILHAIHTLTHTLWQGYSLLYILSHIHYAKDTPCYTYSRDILSHIHYAKDTPCYTYSSDLLHMKIYPHSKTAVQIMHLSDLSKMSDLLHIVICSARHQWKLNTHTCITLKILSAIHIYTYIMPRILPALYTPTYIYA